MGPRRAINPEDEKGPRRPRERLDLLGPIMLEVVLQRCISISCNWHLRRRANVWRESCRWNEI